ncbi:MAG: hypothetical protein ACXW3O_15315 [Brevundimonas sp.]
MKTIITIAAAALLVAAGTAAAEDPQSSVTVGGNAPAICNLPVSYSFVSGNAGANASEFSSNSWMIPQSALAGAGAVPASGAEYAIRVRGTGFCNTSHTISVTTARGGLSTGDEGAAAPAGFANRRPLNVEAHWSDGGGPLGPKAVISSTSIPGQQGTAPYTVSNSLPPPGTRPFEVRIGMQRPPLGTPMVAGFYWDTLTVTLAAGS